MGKKRLTLLTVAMVLCVCTQARAAEEADDKAECTAQLKRIHQAIQAYRQQHKSLPNWLSDLQPQFVKDTKVLLCPVQRRTGQAQPYEGMADPKLNTTYIYEFCDRVIPPNTWGGDKEITMRTWKSLQMAVLGGRVPMVRCLNHGLALNLSFDGEVWESELTWERAFANVVDFDQLAPRSLMDRFKAETGTETAPAAERPAQVGIPKRDPQATVNQIDLSRFYNVSLHEPWHSDRVGNDLSTLPAGLQNLDGTRFDIRGVVQVSGPQLTAGDKHFPHEVSSIPVNFKAGRLYFLQAAGFVEEDGVTIGQYVIHYADGQKEICPIVYGRHVRDWWYYPGTPKEADQSRIAWTGNNEAAKSWNPPGTPAVTLRLYKTTWQNPHPNSEITTLDFVSGEKNSSPFLIAITAE